ncbi:galactokinase [Pseudovirgaria hyperparasitica]|uniref:Galactokinase n=1 Tax=Pseudovirgaria hyperparasitica TaxID=470096 RepID=A0A6A6WH77_9PEZI|nr:galactokinase [Pseudovirgaria hyperparasitica]KAF2761434.1 galactokinase [Pseudovirgaria hyperparasitica]
MDVPRATSLHDVYTDDAIPYQQKRWGNLLSKFKELYGRRADFVSRSPGRVNVIGEHIDYSLYEVLPMAITSDMLLAVAVRPASDSKPTVRIANMNSKFPAREFEIPTEGDIPIDATENEWSNYFKAGLRGTSKLLIKRRGKFVSVGMDVLADGSVPSGGGLSSSAAFTCASALAVMTANGEERVDKTELTELAIVSERAAGVNSGGMDQAASVFSLRDKALYVSFKPNLTAKSLSFPETDPPFSVVIAQSFVAADKQVTGPVCYNLRVVECTLAAMFLSKAFALKRDLPQDASPLGVSLRGFHDTFFEEKEAVPDNGKVSVQDFKAQLEKLITLTEDYLTEEDGYTREQICALLGTSEEELTKRYMSKFPVRAEKFKLRQRALHAFTEALRVINFHDLLVSGGDDKSSVLKDLGDLLNQSHESSKNVYESSCPELDQLCDLARSAGSVGSRVTGAGWGGCCVHLVPTSKVEAVKEAWISKYYRKRWPDITDETLADAIVVTRPGGGSTVYKVTSDEV